MDAKQVIENIAEETGWNTATKLALALEFIDEQDLVIDFEDFLSERAGCAEIIQPNCQDCGKAHHGNYMQCEVCDKVICDICDSRAYADRGPLCKLHQA